MFWKVFLMASRNHPTSPLSYPNQALHTLAVWRDAWSPAPGLSPWAVGKQGALGSCFGHFIYLAGHHWYLAGHSTDLGGHLYLAGHHRYLVDKHLWSCSVSWRCWRSRVRPVQAWRVSGRQHGHGHRVYPTAWQLQSVAASSRIFHRGKRPNGWAQSLRTSIAASPFTSPALLCRDKPSPTGGPAGRRARPVPGTARGRQRRAPPGASRTWRAAAARGPPLVTIRVPARRGCEPRREGKRKEAGPASAFSPGGGKKNRPSSSRN